MRRLLRLRIAFCVVLFLSAFGASAHASTPIPANHIRIHYFRPDGQYTGWTIYAFGDTTEDTGNYGGGPVQIAGSDSFGVYFDVGVTVGAKNVGLILHTSCCKDPGPNEYVNPSVQGNEFWQVSATTELFTSPPNVVNAENPAIPPNVARVHYYRPDNNFSGWFVYAFNDTTADTGNYGGGPIPVTGSDNYGVYFDIPLKVNNPQDIGFIVHNIQNGTKDTPDDRHLNVSLYNEAWIISGDPMLYLAQPSASQLLNGSFLKSQAFWIDRSTVLIQQAYVQSGGKYFLASDPAAGLALTNTGVTGGTDIPLAAGGTLTPAQLARFPQLATGYVVLTLPSSLKLSDYDALVRGQLAVFVERANGSLTYATGVQDAGALDDLYAYPGKLGVIVHHSSWDSWFEWRDYDDDDAGALKLKVWAPTAQSMKVRLFKGDSDTTPARTLPMHEHDGVWVVTLDPSWIGKYYLLDETVYAPSVRAVVENVVTDPYSIDLALNATKSRFTDVDAPENTPGGWEWDVAPALSRMNDLSIYELHVRDFSVGDATVPAEHRGTYLAFTNANSNGMRHLEQLASSGLKAVHLLPTFHFNSINEDKKTWQTTPNLAAFAPDSQSQQAAVTAIQGADAYNWGYDPDHYLAPEGGYAVNPSNRVKEYRQMVMGLHRAGLRVIQDVVFNHTSGFGEATNSILDQVVPNYYNRLDNDGNLETGSCCADTATEHLMMGKLQQDAILWNAKKYKIDGFRFDIMSFTFVKNLNQIQQALAKLTLERDGVDGSKIYLYGEGFNFGETANSALGVNASQLNLYGNGIGTFNDRIRDGVRGGGPFDDERVQGFATGLFNDPSSFTVSNTQSSSQLSTLLHRTDWIKVGLTGNLRDYTFMDATGATITGAQLDYQGQPTGYTATPVEAINYASVHDNQDLFDTIQVKASENDTSATRARRQVLAMSLIELGQGIPFFQAGDDLLRSKDMDQNSYDSGDWFNKIDWTGLGNNWGIGLPIASQNSSQWSFQQPLLANGALKPTPAEIQSTTAAFQEFLRIRNSSGLFRMGTFAEVQKNLHFLNNGPAQTPGLILMELDQTVDRYGSYQHIVAVFNANTTQQTYTATSLAGLGLQLHPVQKSGSDAVVKTSTFDSKTGTIVVPGLTTAVFVSGGGR